MERRLIICIGVYDTLDIFAYELKKEFERMGYEIMLFDSSDIQESIRTLAEFVQRPVKAVITFNNLGYNMELVPGKNIWDELGIYCINILMDHPFCYRDALEHSPIKSAVLCTDRNHMRYVQRFHPQIPITGYLPHAGVDRQSDTKTGKDYNRKPIKDRSIDVLYAGGLSRKFIKNVRPDFKKYTEFDAKEIAEEALQRLMQSPSMTTEDAIEEVLKEHEIQLTDTILCQLIADLHYIDLLAVSHYREQTIKVLVENGVKVHLYGYGWEECSWINNPNLVYGGRVSADEIVELMQDAKIVLSTMTWFKDGTHDRVFNGMLAGAVAVTDSSVYMKEEFPETREERLVMFELPEIANLPTIIKELLVDTSAMQKIADAGYLYAKEHHTWQVRAHELEETLLNQL